MPTKYIWFIVLIPIIFACNSKRSNIKNSETINPETYIGVLDSTINESSGLIIWDNLFWTFNDSGGKNEIYGLDFKTGSIRCTVQLSNTQNIDWEDIAQDKRYIYIAETGNNFGSRHDQKIYRIRKSDITSEPLQSVIADSISFQYSDQTDFTVSYHKTSYDCEALISFHDSLYVFTKDWLHFHTKVYGFPAKPGNYSLNPIDSYNVNGMITGADILPDGRYALIGYKDFHSFIWIFNKKKNKFFDNPRFINFGKLENSQTEGICFSKKGDLYISCEQTVNYPQQIWKISKKELPK
jgi:hypothetical protein